MQVTQGLILTQRKFTLDLLQEFDCTHSIPVICPLYYNIKLSPEEGTPLQDPSTYRRLIGKLNFLTHTRPDIAFVVQHLSQFLQHPREPNWRAAHHVLRYLKGEPALGILLNNSPTLDLLAYCDADWGSCPHSRRSISGFVVFFGGTLIN